MIAAKLHFILGGGITPWAFVCRWLKVFSTGRAHTYACEKTLSLGPNEVRFFHRLPNLQLELKAAFYLTVTWFHCCEKLKAL